MNSYSNGDNNRNPPHRTQRNYAGNRPSSRQNQNSHPIQNLTFQQEKITFSIKNEFFSGPQVSIPLISMKRPRTNFINSLKQFELVANSN